MRTIMHVRACACVRAMTRAMLLHTKKIICVLSLVQINTHKYLYPLMQHFLYYLEEIIELLKLKCFEKKTFYVSFLQFFKLVSDNAKFNNRK